MLVVPNTAAVLDPFELCSQHSVLPYLLPTVARGSPLARQGGTQRTQFGKTVNLTVRP